MLDAVRLARETDRAAVEEIVQAAYQPWVEVIGGRPQPMDADYAALIAAGRVHVTGSVQVEGLIVLIPEDSVLAASSCTCASSSGAGRHGTGTRAAHLR